MPFRRFFPREPQHLLLADRIYLRQPKPSDFRNWSKLRDDSRAFLAPWEPTWPDDALEKKTYARRLAIWQAEGRRGNGYVFFIFTRRDDTLLGGINLSHVKRGVCQSASLGYWLGVGHTGQGYMSEALARATAFAFHDLGLHRLEAACLPENEPSQRLLLRCNFLREGLARGMLRINGSWRDHVIYARLAGDSSFRQGVIA